MGCASISMESVHPRLTGHQWQNDSVPASRTGNLTPSEKCQICLRAVEKETSQARLPMPGTERNEMVLLWGPHELFSPSFSFRGSPQTQSVHALRSPSYTLQCSRSEATNTSFRERVGPTVQQEAEEEKTIVK